jgi:ubiquinone/menaquinone biosynthesis C-methylase UbiE
MVHLPPAGAFLDTNRVASSIGVVQGMHIADLGCGSGYFVVTMAKYVGAQGVVWAVDVMQEPLDSVRAKAEALGLGNIRAVRADVEVLGGTGIPSNSVDVALVINNLFQSQKKEAFVVEAARMTKSGGKVVIIEWKKGESGFGPPDELRTSEEGLQAIAKSAGLVFERSLDAGRLYTGLLLNKP